MKKVIQSVFSLFFLLCLSLLIYACSQVTYIITFESNGANAIDAQIIESGELILEPSVSKQGYVLEGWYTSNDQGQTFHEKWVFSSNIPNSNLTLYAKWIVSNYTISFDTNGGTAISPIQANYQSVIALPTNPTRNGDEFVGWYLDEQLTIPFSESQTIIANITLYAKWNVLAYDIALITDTGQINDKSYNQSAWEGIEEYATTHNKRYTYYVPTAFSLDMYLEAIALAVSEGAKIIVTPGFLFENSVHKAQYLYPDVNFILIDGSPNNIVDWGTMATYDGLNPDFTIASNTVSIFFDEHEAGFLAGYATYKDGLNNLGFMGGMAVPAVIRYGIGYIAGAYYAASENQTMSYTFNANHYEYLYTFAPSDSTVSMANSWFTTGQVDAIFAVAGGSNFSVYFSAEQNNKKAIGVDVDQSHLSNTVITSAMKDISYAVYQMLEYYDSGQQVWGMSITLGAAEDSIGLPIDTSSWRFQNFTLIQYLSIYLKLANGTVVVPSDKSQLQQFITALGFSNNQALIDKI